MNVEFEKVIIKKQIEILAQTADIVWHDAFKNILSLNQIDYMVDKFQSYNSLFVAITENNYHYYLIKESNVVLGYTGLQEQEKKLFLSKLYILSQYRGKHIASKTFEFIENLAKEKKLKSIYLTANKHNYHAIEVYKHKGFTKIKDLVTDIGNGFVMDDYVFEKNLE